MIQFYQGPFSHEIKICYFTSFCYKAAKIKMTFLLSMVVFFIIAKPCLPFIKLRYVKWFRIRWTYSARIFHVLHIWFKIYIVCSFFLNCTLASLALIACRGYLRGLIYLYRFIQILFIQKIRKCLFRVWLIKFSSYIMFLPLGNYTRIKSKRAPTQYDLATNRPIFNLFNFLFSFSRNKKCKLKSILTF